MTPIARTFIAVRVAGLALLLACGVSHAVNGIAVSIRAPFAEKSIDLKGDIQRITIQDDKIVKDTIIYSCANGLAYIPCISQDAKKVCFFKLREKRVNNQTITGDTAYVSVIDIDGRNLRNLVAFTGTLAPTRYDYGFGGPDRYIDWPAGDWVYYQKPTTTEIWKVNVNTLANEKVISYPRGDGVPYLVRWNLSADGTRACHVDELCTFPGRTDCARGDPGYGCNHVLSASGRFHSGWKVGSSSFMWDTSCFAWLMPERYSGSGYPARTICIGGHSYFEFSDWNWTTGMRPRFGLFVNDYMSYRQVSYILGPQYLQDEIGNPQIGSWCEFPRFAANSDKWIAHCGGKVQLLWNWADRKAVLGCHAKMTYMGPANDAGDFWVRPPHDSLIGTYHEDIRGNWQKLGSQSTCALPDYIACPGTSSAYECALKYGDVVIMPQSVYNLVAAGQPVNAEIPESNRSHAWAVVLPDFNTIVVQPNQSIDVTVTNQYYDPIDPFFGKPAPPVHWKIVGQGATITSGTGVKETITTSSSFSACSVEVSITVGATTRTVRKLVASQAVGSRGPVGSPAAAVPADLRIASSSLGALTVSLDGPGLRSLDVYRADGRRVFGAVACRGAVAIPAGTLRPGLYVFRWSTVDGNSARRTWLMP